MSDRVSAEIPSLVEERAGNVCEYCLFASDDSYFRHQIEHIISRKHGGRTELGNLALACVFCNRNKGSDVGSIVSDSQDFIRFYNPRSDVWSEHFRLAGPRIVSLSPIGEATLRILQMKSIDRTTERETLARVGRYPSEAALILIREH